MSVLIAWGAAQTGSEASSSPDSISGTIALNGQDYSARCTCGVQSTTNCAPTDIRIVKVALCVDS